VAERAAGVFAARGYDATTMQELAGELGIAAGAIYHYFRSKEELLIAICDQLMDPLLQDAQQLRAERQLEPADRLRRLVQLWVAHVVSHQAHMLVFQQERHAIETGDQWRGVRASRKSFEAMVATALADVETAGAAAYRDRRLALAALLGMVNHTAQWFKPRGRLSPTDIADGYVDLVLGMSERDRLG
jgi:AcrR family transcriptional regulator